MLEAITLNPMEMDADMQRQLGLLSDEAAEEEEEEHDGDEDEDREEEDGDLADDFVVQLMAAAGDDDDDGFDFEAHVARLTKLAEEQESLARARPAEGEDDGEGNDEDDVGGGARRRPREVDEQFEKVLAEYEDDEDEDEDEDGDDDDGGEVEAEAQEDGEATTRSRPARLSHADPRVLDALDEFLRERAEERTAADVVGQTRRRDAVGPSTGANAGVAPNRNRAAGADDGGEDEEDEAGDEIGALERNVVPEWGTYLARKPAPKFDVESIVSTRTTTDNHPAVIEVPASSRRARRARAAADGAFAQEAESASEDAERDEVRRLTQEVTRLTVEALAGRRREETPEERRARKVGVKAQRRDRRAEKKATKVHFAEARSRFTAAMTAQAGRVRVQDLMGGSEGAFCAQCRRRFDATSRDESGSQTELL